MREPGGRRFSYARALVRVLPALLIATGLFYDHFTPREFTAVPFFTAAPLVAAPLFSLHGTVVTGVASIAGITAVRLYYGDTSSVDAITEIATVATVAVLAVLINRLVRRSDARLATAREIAEAAQRAVLPVPQERIGGLEIAARYEAAQAGASIGGDLYAVQDSPHGVRLIVGDVRGKGLGAVSAVAVLIGAFREAAEQESTLEAVAQRLERALAREATRREAARRDATVEHEGFVTAVLAEFPHGAGRARIVNRGHPSPCCCTPTAFCAPWKPRSPRFPSAWTTWAPGPTARRRPDSRPAPRCSSTPTASPRRGTRAAPSTTRPSACPDAPSPPRAPC